MAIALTVRPVTAQEQPPVTRIAVINVGEVFTNYTRAKEGKKELEVAVAPYKQLMDKLRDESTKLQQLAADKLEPDQKADITKQLLSLRRQSEDLNAELQKVAGKKSEQIVTNIYADLETAVRRYAEAHEIDLVLTYGEPLKDDRLSYANVTRKLNAANQGGIVPIFIRPRIDITQAVLKSLNEAYASRK
jgi:Skp family chaperone for outer membrane proteins